jgi:hypothetical protein
MTKYFALLGETPRPWLDVDEVKARYHELSAREHPDADGATADFAEINRGFQVLSDPATRVRHLLEVEGVALARTQGVPEDIARFFGPVAEVTHCVEVFLKKHAGVASPLGRALLSTEQYTVQERVEATLAGLVEKQDGLLERLREIDAVWETDRAGALGVLPGIWQSLGYTTKWIGSLREWLFRLASL